MHRVALKLLEDNIVKTLTALLSILIITSLSGCGLFEQKQEPKVIYKTTVIAPPDNLIIDCLVEPPPNKEAYMAATDKEREKMLAAVIQTQFKNTFVCNNRLKELRAWKVKQLDMYNTPTETK